MKKTRVITSLLVAALAISCKPSGDKPVALSNEATAPRKESVQVATKEIVQDVQDYTFEKKTEFVAAMQSHLAEMNRDLDDLSVRIEKSSEAVKAEAKPRLAALREQATQWNKQIGEAGDATTSTWSVIKVDVEKTYAALKDGLAQSRQTVSDKIAP
jgi:leucyl aminopeptidase (aminopeptidase T)